MPWSYNTIKILKVNSNLWVDDTDSLGVCKTNKEKGILKIGHICQFFILLQIFDCRVDVLYCEKEIKYQLDIPNLSKHKIHYQRATSSHFSIKRNSKRSLHKWKLPK